MAATEAKNNDKFKLPGSSVDEIFKIIQGYTSIGKSASLADISKSTGIHETIISRNAGFLVSIGVLEGGAKKAATETGQKLGLALMHNMPEEIELLLADIVGENEFFKSVLAAVRIRKGMDESSLKSHIAYSAGLSKTAGTTTGTGAVVDFLKRAGSLKLEEGKLVVGTSVARPVASTAPTMTALEISPSPDYREAISDQSKLDRGITIEANSSFAISIKVEVHCDAKDLDDLGVKLRKVVDDFSRQSRDEADDLDNKE
ncbi:MAG: hypothetical protein AAGC58_10065 [Asticcacaulis sp.]